MGATERVKEYLENKGITKYKFYKTTGFSNKFLDNSSNMGTNKAEIILRYYPDINPFWLLTGNGNMLINNILNEPNAVYKLKTDHLIDSQSIPLYDIEAVAGLVPLFQGTQETKPIDHISIPRLPKCDGAVYVTGDSMYPLLKSGDIIMYKEIHDIVNDIFWGEMYLLSIQSAGEEYITVKYIQKSDKGEQYIKLVSQNKHHQDRDIKLNRIKALALVKASVRINSMS